MFDTEDIDVSKNYQASRILQNSVLKASDHFEKLGNGASLPRSGRQRSFGLNETKRDLKRLLRIVS